jgi:hypothetical protein
MNTDGNCHGPMVLLIRAVIGILMLALPVMAQVPDNNLPLRIGSDQGGGSLFQGRIGAVRLYGRALAGIELKKLSAVQPDEKCNLPGILGEWLQPRLPLVSERMLNLTNGCTIEAWIRPDDGAIGRIVDKITPGGSDGFLLDLFPSNTLRLIVGSDMRQYALPHTNGWTHVAATVDDSGLLALYVNGACVSGNASQDDGVTLVGKAECPGKPLTLWYRHPARRWTEAAVIGNGRLGGMVWGGVKKEHIDLNEDTLWSGEPYDNINTNGLKSLPEIRRLLIAGKNKEAQQLVERDMNGKFNQNYQPLGDLTIEFPVSGEAGNYRRELDLEQALARVQFVDQGIHYTREVFASSPAQAIVVRLTSDKPGKLSFTAFLGCQLHHVTKAGQNFLRLTGRCPAHTDPSYASQDRKSVV